jgi:hypothetical protein
MKKILKILVVILVLTQSSFAQKYDSSLVSKKAELNFAETKMRGIESNGVTYFVETDLQTISAYKSGKLKWKTNVISVCGKPSVGKPEIRWMKLKAEKLIVTYGKHSFAEVDTESGKAEFWGAD